MEIVTGNGNLQTDRFLELLGLAHIWTEPCEPTVYSDHPTGRAPIDQNEIDLGDGIEVLESSCAATQVNEVDYDGVTKERPRKRAARDCYAIDLDSDDD